MMAHRSKGSKPAFVLLTLFGCIHFLIGASVLASGCVLTLHGCFDTISLKNKMHVEYDYSHYWTGGFVSILATFYIACIGRCLYNIYIYICSVVSIRIYFLVLLGLFLQVSLVQSTTNKYKRTGVVWKRTESVYIKRHLPSIISQCILFPSVSYTGTCNTVSCCDKCCQKLPF